jgi:hypothetical protein
MKNQNKPHPQISSRAFLFLFSSLVLAILLAGCECTKGYFTDRKEEVGKNSLVDFDSSYYIIGELVEETFGSKRFLLKIHGSDYSSLEQGLGFVRPLELSRSTLYWTDMWDSLRFVREKENNRYYSVEDAFAHKPKELQMVVYFEKKDADGKVMLTKKQYVLKRYRNCRVGLH